MPLISIIVVCRNPGPKLRDALASVHAQRLGDFEVVVIDGASSDGSREWLESQRTVLGTLISEPDLGVYDAMNKGLAAARGDWVLFLGADDRLAGDDVFSRVAETLKTTTAGVVAGTAHFDNGRVYAPRPTTAVRRNFVHHQATFYRRGQFQHHGGFDLGLHIQADYDFNLRLLRAGVSFAPTPLLIAKCSSGGLSDAGHWMNYAEEIKIRHRHFPAWRCLLWDLASVARFLRKRIIRFLS